MQNESMIEFHAPNHGGMAEWLKAPVLKTGMGRKLHRGFESLSLRQTEINAITKPTIQTFVKIVGG